jgi:hypothetical protein
MFCVTISDYFMTEPETPLEFYSSLPTIDPFYSDIFSRLKFSVAENGRRISFHHLFDTPSFEASAADPIPIFFLIFQKWSNMWI